MNNKQYYQNQMKLSFVEFIAELPNFIAMAISAFVSNSLIVWLDFMDSLNNVTSAFFVTVLSKKLIKNLKYEYNYGVGKLEAISSLLCDAQLMLGLVIMFIACIYQLFHPERPSTLIFYVILVKISNIAFDLFFLFSQKKIYEHNKTAVTESEYHAQIQATSFDVIASICLMISYIFIDYQTTWLISPALSMILDILFVIRTIKRMKGNIIVLTDKTLDEQEQMKILKVLNKYYDTYETCSIDSKKNGEHVWIDLKMTFDKQTTYEEIKGILEGISKDMKEEIPDAKVAIKITNKQEEKEITEM